MSGGTNLVVNAGLYVSEKSALVEFRNWNSETGIIDFGKDVFPAMVCAGKKLLGYNSPEFIKDIGTLARYDKISRAVRGRHRASGSLLGYAAARGVSRPRRDA